MMGIKELWDGLGELVEGMGELGQPDLLRKVADGIAGLGRHGDRGRPALPREVEVHIEVAEGSLEVIERFVQDPAFDTEVQGRLLNELVRVPPEELPLRRYIVEAGPRTRVVVRETPPRRFVLCIEGGDRDGARLPLTAGRRDFLLGRGEWHGDEPGVANDIVLSESEKAVSRRAARLHRCGRGLELESLDQQEALVVIRREGERLHPVLAAGGRVLVGPGDVIELTDGRAPVLRVRVEDET
jgi:hypothetical protein